MKNGKPMVRRDDDRLVLLSVMLALLLFIAVAAMGVYNIYYLMTMPLRVNCACRPAAPTS
jgi:hypothetical protein